MRLILIALCLVAAGLYIKTLLPLEGDDGAKTPPAVAVGNPADGEPNALRPVPDSQLTIIRDVFAPEMK